MSTLLGTFPGGQSLKYQIFSEDAPSLLRTADNGTAHGAPSTGGRRTPSTKKLVSPKGGDEQAGLPDDYSKYRVSRPDGSIILIYLKEDLMRKFMLIFAVVVFVTGLLTVASYAENPKPKTEIAKPVTMSEMDLRLGMRMLWEDHITYTRNYIISSLAGLEDGSAVAERLLRNQDDIGNAIKPFYGEEAGKKLTALLRDHILTASEVVKAAKDGNSDVLTTAQAKWKANAEEIATFLSGANPSWTKKEMSDMLAIHLDLTTGEVVSRLKKDWTADIDFYDKGHTHMMKFADVLTAGLVKQFPNKFKK